jgi:hypothetical protein
VVLIVEPERDSVQVVVVAELVPHVQLHAVEVVPLAYLEAYRLEAYLAFFLPVPDQT